jgi:anti-sigma B factor antagonist
LKRRKCDFFFAAPYYFQNGAEEGQSEEGRGRSMKIKIQEKEVVTVVSLEGNVMQEDVTVFRSRLDDLLHNGKVRIVLDMNNVTYLSSMCLAVIVDMKSRLTAQQGDLKLASVNHLVRNLFEMTRLIKKIDIYESVDVAAEAFSAIN